MPNSRALGRRQMMIPAALAVAVGLVLGLDPMATSATTGLPRPVSHSAAVAARVPQSERPNIVMVMADDMRVDDLRYAPNVRRILGGHGLTFQNSFSPYPLCCPARASFLSGEYAHNHHVFSHLSPWGFQAFDDHYTLPAILNRAGYNTAFVGKYLNGYGPDTSLVTGRRSLHYVPNGWTDWYGAVENTAGVHGGTYDYFDTPFNINGTIDNSHRGQYQTNVIGRFARQLVDKDHMSKKPFFAYVSFVAPHHGRPTESDDPAPVMDNRGSMTQFNTPARPSWVKGLFDSVITRAPGMPADGGPSEADMSDKPAFMRQAPEPNQAELAALTNVARQRAEAVYVLDREVGRLVSELKATHEWGNTILMFTSDNGYFMGEHRRRTGKIMAQEPSLRVPFLVTGPGMREAANRYDPITTVDLTATIIDLAEAKRYRHYVGDGMSKRATFYGGDQGWAVPVQDEGRVINDSLDAADAPGFDDPRNSIGIRTPRYSFVEYRTGEMELYDLKRDPNELHSQTLNPAYAERLAALVRLWWRFKDCKGLDCHAQMPSALRATKTQERLLTERYWAGVNARYQDAS